MTATVCYVQSCIYHHNRVRCGAGRIGVDMQTSTAFCSTYRNQHLYDSGGDEDTLSLTNALELSSDPVVECQAVICFYNQQRDCYAAAIEVKGEDAVDSRQTRCRTFLPQEGDESGTEASFSFGAHVD